MSNLRYKLEALLFSSARSMKIEELCKLTNASSEEIRETLDTLKKSYSDRDSSIALVDEGDAFKLNVKSEHSSVVRQVVSETELSKTLMETLAVIAFKYPIKQSELIKIRTNKAYDHLRELEESGYITRQKFGRTKLIKLTPKFFEYFDLPAEKLKEKFQDFGGIAKAIQDKEEEVKNINKDIKRKAIEAGKKNEVDLVDDTGHKKKLETYDNTLTETEEGSKVVEPYTEKVGELEVTDVPLKEEKEDSEESLEESDEDTREIGEPGDEEVGNTDEDAENTDEDSAVDDELDGMLHPKKETDEGDVQEEVDDKDVQEEEPSGSEKIQSEDSDVDDNPKEEVNPDEESDEKGVKEEDYLGSEKIQSEDSGVDDKLEAMMHPKKESDGEANGVMEEFQQPPEEEREEKNEKENGEGLQEGEEEEKNEKENGEGLQEGEEEKSSEEPKDLLDAAFEEEEKEKEDKKKRKQKKK